MQNPHTSQILFTAMIIKCMCHIGTLTSMETIKRQLKLKCLLPKATKVNFSPLPRTVFQR